MQHRGKFAMSGKAERRPSPDRQSPELRTETGADSVGEDTLPTGAEVGKDDGDSLEGTAETHMPAEGPGSPAEKDSMPSKAEAAVPPAHAGSGAPVSQTPPRPPLPSKPMVLTQDKANSLDRRLRDTRPTPAPRRTTDGSALSPPTSHPVPRPRSTLQGEGSESGPGMVNGKRAQWWQGLPSTSAAATVVSCRLDEYSFLLCSLALLPPNKSWAQTMSFCLPAIPIAERAALGLTPACSLVFLQRVLPVWREGGSARAVCSCGDRGACEFSRCSSQGGVGEKGKGDVWG